MGLSITKINLEPLFEFLSELNLKGGLSRNKVKFNKLIEEELKVIQDDKNEIFKTYGKCDENGELEYNENQAITIPQDMIDGFTLEMNELYSEKFTINTEIHETVIKAISTIMLNEDVEVKAKFAIMHNEVCEQLEKITIGS